MKDWKTKAIPKEVWILGFVSLCMDASSELIHSLLPILMVSTLGATMVQVGLLEGLAEAFSLILKLFSGILSDYWKKRKWLTLIGYGLSALIKPLFPFATSLKMIFTARLLDRVGKGIRGAPRDALLSELAPAEMRGACFGLRQALDTVGACLGPLIAILGIAYYHGAIRSTLYLAIPPAILSVVLLAFFVHEPEPEPKPESEPESKTEQLKSKPTLNFNFSSFMHLGKRFWQMLLIAMLMTLARFSDAFLLLKAHAIGFSLSAIPLVMLVMNAVYALSAYPAGFLSDRWSRKSVLLLGTALLIVADLFLALGTDNLTLFLGVILWGMHLGLTQGVLTAMVADSTSLSLRGSAYGLFYFTCGIMALISSVLAGLIWELYGPLYTFCLSAFVALGTCCALSFFTQAGKSMNK